MSRTHPFPLPILLLAATIWAGLGYYASATYAAPASSDDGTVRAEPPAVRSGVAVEFGVGASLMSALDSETGDSYNRDGLTLPALAIGFRLSPTPFRWEIEPDGPPTGLFDLTLFAHGGIFLLPSQHSAFGCMAHAGFATGGLELFAEVGVRLDRVGIQEILDPDPPDVSSIWTLRLSVGLAVSFGRTGPTFEFAPQLAFFLDSARWVAGGQILVWVGSERVRLEFLGEFGDKVTGIGQQPSPLFRLTYEWVIESF